MLRACVLSLSLSLSISPSFLFSSLLYPTGNVPVLCYSGAAGHGGSQSPGTLYSLVQDPRGPALDLNIPVEYRDFLVNPT